jgi:deoxyadenosine/deoxycytidine kinase
MAKEIKHIAVAGNIGSGKTTLTRKLAHHYGWEPQLEEVDNNPYIEDFYQDMPRWSFHMQIYYLNLRFQQILDIRKGYNTIIQDRTIYEDATIFAANLHSMGLLETRDFKTYQSFYNTLLPLITPPDLLIYLKGSISALVDNIQKRGRYYEDSIRIDYLKKLNARYDDWILTYPHNLLVIDIETCNFAEKNEDFGSVISKIDAQLSGLF